MTYYYLTACEGDRGPNSQGHIVSSGSPLISARTVETILMTLQWFVQEGYVIHLWDFHGRGSLHQSINALERKPWPSFCCPSETEKGMLRKVGPCKDGSVSYQYEG